MSPQVSSVKSLRCFQLGLVVSFLTLCNTSSAQAGAPAATKAGAAPAAGAKAPVASKWPLYDQGVAAYQARRYNEASALFGESIKNNEPGTAPLCLLYQGHCALAMGNRSQAIASYNQLLTSYKTSREAAVAQQSLAKISPGSAAAATTSSDSTATASDGDEEGSPSVALLKSRVEVAKPIIGHPEVSMSLVSSMDDWLKALPKPIRKTLNKYQIKFVLTPTLVDKLPALGYREGRGYEGATYKSCPGMFWRDTVYICESTVDETTDAVHPPRSMDDMKATFLHECGHALDTCHGQYSEKEEFRHNYYLDIAHVPDNTANKIRYYLQKSVARQHETCAELTSILMGNKRDHYQEMRESFPNTIKVIQKELNLEAPKD